MLIIVIIGKSQSLTPFVVASSGGFYSNSAGMLSTTIGEMTMVNTFTSSTNILTQGFQQVIDMSVNVSEHQRHQFEIAVYPNPVATELSLSIQCDQRQPCKVTFIDIIGNLAKAASYIASPGLSVYKMDVSNLAAGVYLLKVDAGESSKAIRFIKN